MKDKKFAPWSTGELPSFNFDNDVDPSSDCQDVPYDSPNPLALVEVGVITLSNQEGDLFWKWGNLPAGTSKDWKDFRYKFEVKKEGQAIRSYAHRALGAGLYPLVSLTQCTQRHMRNPPLLAFPQILVAEYREKIDRKKLRLGL